MVSFLVPINDQGTRMSNIWYSVILDVYCRPLLELQRKYMFYATDVLSMAVLFFGCREENGRRSLVIHIWKFSYKILVSTVCHLSQTSCLHRLRKLSAALGVLLLCSFFLWWSAATLFLCFAKKLFVLDRLRKVSCEVPYNVPIRSYISQ
jgi:hypothetical protein